MSVASNLAEGDERGMDKDSVRFFFMAKGSLAELRTQIQIAYKVAQMEKSTYEDVESQCEVLGRMIGSLIQARRRAPRRSPRASRPQVVEYGSYPLSCVLVPGVCRRSG